jgi:hypothetical protein
MPKELIRCSEDIKSNSNLNEEVKLSSEGNFLGNYKK